MRLKNKKNHIKKMNIAIKTLNILTRTILAIAISFSLFVSLPLFYRMLGSDLMKKEAKIDTSPVLMKVETQKPEKKKVQTQKPRRIESSRTTERARSFSLKFSPDLEVGSSEGVVVEDQNLETMIFEEGEADANAVPVSRLPVAYPRRAREEGIEGVVEMIILIDRKGKVAKIDFVSIPHAMFKKPVEIVVKQWKFKPAMNKGIPVNMRVRQSIEFFIEK